MTKQEKIREGIKLWMLENDACHNSPCGKTECNSKCVFLNVIVDDFLDRLHSQGVVIKVEGELSDSLKTAYHKILALPSKDMLEKAGYTLTEPLIEGSIMVGNSTHKTLT